ncbi:DUF1783-domain-containing protein [Thozetella sp. PMI_491]|nr:DUF1783-domain-containing protein [Thozetella sp. PMI_491]
MLSRIAHRRAPALLQRTSVVRALPVIVPRRSLVAPPKPGDGPLMERRADRELPDVEGNRFRWSRTMPMFLAIIAVASVAIFNYQKLSSPVVGATLYALRTNERAREYLGDEIYFKQRIPWISGEMNQLQGRINIRFAVKGTRNTGFMTFASFRPTPRGLFETTEWSLETTDGRRIDLLEGGDPFRNMVSGGLDLDDDEDLEATTRGFRQMPK